jgi:hypothetical protein
MKSKCPHCKKPLNIPDEWAGKRVKCPECRKVLQVPKPAPTAAPAVDVEKLAAELFSDAPAQEKVPEAPPIKLNCFYCDEPITFPAELAGKQAPCPSCRRILKVPLPVKQGPKDWRQVEHNGPSAARQEQPANLEGAWGSTTSRSTVSQEALEEAEAIPDVPIPLTQREKFNRALLTALGIFLIVGGPWGGWRLITSNRQDKAFQQALRAVDKDGKVKLAPETAVVVHRAAGEYFLHEDDLENAKSHFSSARGRLAQLAAAADHDFLVVDLALSQIDLGGSRQQEIDRVRLKGDDAQKEVRQTLQQLQQAEARFAAARLVARKYLSKAGGDAEQRVQAVRRALALARMVSPTSEDVPEMLARVGLEVLDDRKQAEEIAGQALRPYQERAEQIAKESKQKKDKKAATRDKKDKGVQPLPVVPSLLALLLALDQSGKAAQLMPYPAAGQKSIPVESRIGYAQGAAYQGKWSEARRIAVEPGDSLQRVRALVAVAEVAADKGADEARDFVERALTIVEKERPLATPWLWRQLVEVGARAGLADRIPALAERLASSPKEQIRFELLRVRLAQGGPAELDGLAKCKDPRALALLARRCAAQGASSAAVKEVAGLDEALRPAGAAGVALGMQDTARQK